MEAMWKAGVAFVVSLAAGFLIGKSGTRETIGNRSDKPEGRNPKVARHARWQAGDFTKALKTDRENRWEPLFAEEFKDWTTAEIAAAVNEGMTVPERVIEGSPADDLLDSLICEWVRRDLDSVLAWFEKLPTDGMRNQFGHCLAAAWPKERAEEGLEYVFAHPRMFDRENGMSSGSIIQMAIEKAAEKSPSAVADVLVRVTGHGLNPRYAEGWKFPPGFDFSKLAASPEARALFQGRGFFFGAWMSQNREQAFGHLLASGDEKILVSDLFADVMPQNGGIDHTAAADRAKWLASQLDRMDEAKRKTLTDQAAEAFGYSPDTLAAFTRATVDEELRRDFTAKAIHSLAQKSILSTMDYLEATATPEQRLAALELLESVETDLYRRRWWSEPWERSVREKLASWNASPERADAIVKHLKEAKRW